MAEQDEPENEHDDETPLEQIEGLEGLDPEEVKDIINYTDMFSGGATVGNLAANTQLRWAITIVIVIMGLIAMM